MKSGNRLFALAICVTVVLGWAAPSPGDELSTEKINKAIARGVQFVRGEQEKETNLWSGPANEATQVLQRKDLQIGATALAGLTLLECDVPAKDAAIQKAADAIRPLTVSMTYTYSISLAIMFLDRLGDPGDVALIESLTVRLLAGQNRSGGWSYNCPAISEAEMRRLTTHIKQRNELVAKGELPTAGKRRTEKDLPREILAQLVQVARSGANDTGGTGDNSNTQFATIALWISRRHGLPVDSALTRIADCARFGQYNNGAWGYNRPMNAQESQHLLMPISSAPMICSGLLQLAVGNGVFNEVILRKKAKGVRDPSKDPAIRKGLAVLATQVGIPAGDEKAERVPRFRSEKGRQYYFLWSLERTAMVYGLKKIGNKDWYAWGSEILLANQDADGSWRGSYSAGGVDTCFALLFLRRSNLCGDLTTSLKGSRLGSEISLKLGGIGGGKLVLDNDIEGGINSKKKNRKGNKDPKVKPKNTAANVNDEGAEIKRLSRELVQAPRDKQDDLLRGLEKGKGLQYTEALAASIPLLKGAVQEKAREALSHRMTRMSVETLRAKLADESLEIRRAAAAACAAKKAKSLTPNLIALLVDPELPVAEAAHRSLKELTAKDFGPEADATRTERQEAVKKWKAWWKSQQQE